MSLIETILTTRPIEDLFGWLMYNNRAHDSGLFTRHPAISSTPQTIPLTSPFIGPSGSLLSKSHASRTIGGLEQIPSLTWSAPASTEPKIKEWLLIVEDPDAPLPEPIVHGIYLGIRADKTTTMQADFEVEDERTKMCKGGFRYGGNRAGSVYQGPRPIMRHGEHRYFWSVVGLSERVDWEEMGRKGKIGKGEVLRAVEGKVVAWGEWNASYAQGRE